MLRAFEFKIPELCDDRFLQSLAGGSTPTGSVAPVEASPNAALLETLRVGLLELSQLEPQKRGYAFERTLTELFHAFALAPRSSFRLVGEQIDGSFELNATYLVEAKWTTPAVGYAELVTFAGKVEEKKVWVSSEAPTLSRRRKAIRSSALSQVFDRLRVVREPGMCAHSLLGNRDISGPTTVISGPHREGDESQPVMNDPEKSELPIVALRSTNKADGSVAESVERRGSAKGNGIGATTRRTPSREACHQVSIACDKRQRQIGNADLPPSCIMSRWTCFDNRTSGLNGMPLPELTA